MILKDFMEQAKKDYQIFLNEYDGSEFMKLNRSEEFLSGLLHNQLIGLRNESSERIGDYVKTYLGWIEEELKKIK